MALRALSTSRASRLRSTIRVMSRATAGNFGIRMRYRVSGKQRLDGAGIQLEQKGGLLEIEGGAELRGAVRRSGRSPGSAEYGRNGRPV